MPRSDIAPAVGRLARSLFILAMAWPALGAAAERPAACVPVEGRRPPWLAAMDAGARDALLGTSWYRDWRTVTADLCTDVTHIGRDNPGVKIVWRGRAAADDKLLFYGAGNRHYEPDTVFGQGLQVIRADGSLKLRPGTGVGTASALKSSTYLYALAERFALVSHNERHYVYVIHAPGGVAVDESIGIAGPDVEIPGAGNEEEIAFPGGVRSRFVKGLFESRLVRDAASRVSYVETLSYTPNPGYLQGAGPAGDGEVDVMVASHAAVDVAGGRSVDASTWRFAARDAGGAATQVRLASHDGSAARWVATGRRQMRFPPPAGYACALVDTALQRNRALAVTRTPIDEAETPRRNAGTCVYLSDRDIAVRNASAVAVRGPDHVWTRLSVHWDKPADTARIRGYRLYLMDIYGTPVRLIGEVDNPEATRYAVAEEMARKLGLRDAVDGLIQGAIAIYTLIDGAPEAESSVPVRVGVSHPPAGADRLTVAGGAER
ncbi:scabin-related ADP-ribosyltransferase [Chromobacterium sp. CV08]|uniref:scabin-related ADP-ribosyltransferase n=1 Tax=Chromobacterium sp. CV08 TaxID=3133274 RepID=UPI003DA84344